MQENKKFNLIYCYDAYCSWCYGIGSVIKEVENNFKDSLQIEVLSGGMLLPENPQPISVIAKPIVQTYKRVEEMTGVKFGSDFLWHIEDPERSDWFPSSLKPAIALSIIKDILPEQSLSFANDIQISLFNEGRDLTDDEAYRHLLEKYKIEPKLFYKALHSAEYEEKARYDFALIKQLGLTSFPIVLLQENESKFHLMAKGYTDYATLEQRINNALNEIKSSNS